LISNSAKVKLSYEYQEKEKRLPRQEKNKENQKKNEEDFVKIC